MALVCIRCRRSPISHLFPSLVACDNLDRSICSGSSFRVSARKSRVGPYGGEAANRECLPGIVGYNSSPSGGGKMVAARRVALICLLLLIGVLTCLLNYPALAQRAYAPGTGAANGSTGWTN